MGNITIQGDLTGDVPGGEVGGASNLTTVGAIPYVSAAGTLNQDPTALFWDAANNRLGVGTNAPSATLEVSGSAPGFTVTRTSISAFTLDNSGSSWRLASTGNQALAFFANSAERGRFASTTGNLLIGTTTDSNFKLDVAASGSSGTFRVYDQTATTGVTKAVIRAGAGQSTTNLTEWQNSAGTVLASVTSAGAIASSGSIGINDTGYALTVTGSAGSYVKGLSLPAGSMVGFTGSGNWYSALDLAIARSAAGILEINNGTAGTYRDLRLRGLIASASIIQTFLTPASASDTGTAGQIGWDTNYIYICTATNTWKRVAIATW